jgi:hypothetical protein
MKSTIYQHIARKVTAERNCEVSGNTEWYDKHGLALHRIEADHLPSGSGIDCGTRIDMDKTTADKIVLNSNYHCMDEHGFYDGWIGFTVTIKPSLLHGITLDIKGPFSDRHGKYADLKDYLGDVFYTCLDNEIDV